MATLSTLYGTSGQTITVTLASLTTGSYQQSASINNSSSIALDALVMLKVKTGASGTTATGSVSVYAYGSVDGGTTFTDGATGSNASFTPTNPLNIKQIGLLNAVANATTYIGGPWSVAAAFGGVLPQFWGIIILNNTGSTLDGTEGNHAKLYQLIQASSA